MKDYLVKVISETGSIRAYAAVTTNLVAEACKRQTPKPLSAVMLGRTLTGAALLGGTLKQDQRLALRLEGNGPVSAVIAESDAHGKVRGYARNSQVDFTLDEDPFVQIRKSIGSAGITTLTKDLGLKEPYAGSVHMVSGEVGDDIAFYLMESEQIPSAVSVGAIPSSNGVGIEIAGGFLIQTIPANGGNTASEEANLEAISEMIKSLDPLTDMLSRGETPETILKQIFAEVPYKTLEVMELTFECSCSKSVILKAISTIDKEELASMAEEEDGIEVACEFCKQKYNINQGELTSLASL